MQDIAISTSATMPTVTKGIQDGDTLNTATFLTVAQNLANGLGALKGRADTVNAVVKQTDDSGGYSLPAGIVSTMPTVGTSLVDLPGTNNTTLSATLTSLKAGDKVRLTVRFMALRGAPANSATFALGDQTTSLRVTGIGQIVTSTTYVPVELHGIYTVPADIASQRFGVLVLTDNASGVVGIQSTAGYYRYFEAIVLR